MGAAAKEDSSEPAPVTRNSQWGGERDSLQNSNRDGRGAGVFSLAALHARNWRPALRLQ